MRLLRYSDDVKLEVTSDLQVVGGNPIPPYAILSHTWQPGEEFTYEDLMRGDDSSYKKSGYTKISLFAQQAKRDGLEYFWVDTCCINKADQVELREAISSMFRWYQHASKCYVYMPDVSYKKRKADNELAPHPWATDFRASRWFTRGWTLQELLAPRSVEFFSREWKKLGDKVSLQTYIQEATRIPTAALEGASLLKFSIEERLKWNEHRETTVPEDRVYCLIGILGTQMTPFYDEGVHGAFARLMHEARIGERCLQDLQPSDTNNDKERIEDTKGGLIRGSYTWVLKDTTFQQWLNGPHSRLLWIKGDPGKGKTMLVCGIIDELKRSTTEPSFFFCQDTDNRINSATSVLRGLIHQLVSQQQPLMSHLRKRYDQAGSAFFQDANAWVALSAIFTDMTKDLGTKTCYMIVDGLDECVVDLPKLLDLIVGTTLTSTNMKWLVSSRNDAHIEQKFKAFCEDSKLSLELDQNAEQVARAVDVYIDHKLSQLETLQEASLRDQVRCELRQKANGTFLWVALMMQELEMPESWDPLAVVQEAPAGLDRLYDRMMNSIQRLKAKTVESCQRLLSTAVVAYRPLSLTEMGSLRGLQSPATALADTVRRVVTLCGSFLTIRNEQIYFVHQSAKDYLSAKMETAVLLPTRSEIDYDLFTQSLRLMSSTLHHDMYELVDVGLHIDEVKVPAPDPLATARYSCFHWVDHLHNSVLSGRPHGLDSLQESNVVYVFLQKYFLYWLEALSLCRSIPAGVLSMSKLVALLKVTHCVNALTELIHDAYRFVMYFKGAIETSALQAYVSALLFSPRSSLVKKLFRHEEPNHVTVIPAMDDGWSMCLQTLEGHKWSNLSVAVSPDSTHLASSSDDGTIAIWHVSSGTCLKTLKGHRSAAYSVAFSPDSTQLASASDTTVKIWNVSSGACLKTLEGHGDRVMSVIFSPDSSQLASASYDKNVKIWDASSGVCLHTLKGHAAFVKSVSFSHDLMHMSSSLGDNTVKIWDISSGACLETLEGHGGHVLSTVFSPNSSQLASASMDKTVKIWDLRCGACTQTLEGHSDEILSIAFSHDSARLASASADETIKIWHLHSGTSLQTLKVLGGNVMAIAFVPDSTWLALASLSGLIEIWDTSSSTCLKSEGHSDKICSIAFSPDSTLLASASKDRTVKIWDTSSGSCVQTLIGHGDAVKSIAFSGNSHLASGSYDTTVKIWDISSGACLRTLKGRRSVVDSVAYSHDSAMLASSDGNVKIWDASTGTCLQTLEVSHNSMIDLVAFSHDSTRLASVSWHFTIKISDVRSGVCLQKLEGYARMRTCPIRWSKSCELVWAYNDRNVKIWDAMSGECLRTLEVQGDSASSAALMTSPRSPQSDETVTQPPFHPKPRFRSDGTWILKNDRKLLWLPTEYRPECFAVAGSCVAIGAKSGKVWMCRFS
ncbi:beta transducin-like protein HET-D2Y [Paraphoma chrysanthemicola]|uniref:Beta transducin-like protein HET-D2Y n=1 Tax=Paraphoma chrysanthemicola TaxID=798071 RepID=A0A8K0VUA6_9PLEO|nr:beta transducin-like protein HET-D2Y [Paraphoma chrysanthemicola]